MVIFYLIEKIPKELLIKTDIKPTTFSIDNRSNKIRTIVDFACDNVELVQEFNRIYLMNKTIPGLLTSAKNRLESDIDRYTFKPSQSRIFRFGISDGDDIGCIYQYILRISTYLQLLPCI